MSDAPEEARWWGDSTRSRNRLSLLGLVRINTLDPWMAALLWLLVAAAPQLAGLSPRIRVFESCIASRTESPGASSHSNA